MDKNTVKMPSLDLQVRRLVKNGKRKNLKDIELVGKPEGFQIRAAHHFGISIISLDRNDAKVLIEELEEWLGDEKRPVASMPVAEP